MPPLISSPVNHLRYVIASGTEWNEAIASLLGLLHSAIATFVIDLYSIAILAGVVKNIYKETNRQERQGRKEKKEKKDI
ncbi:hypothetical protein [Nostoc sp. CHAB 5715]|uniref:hypothetical protein n=1 Tax=Nostoc sp. CHAB 5715 TaxID=2780400 RepID=UPI001E423F5F|nr:hypothetical protein [Nostoc sp. CHAB 5715]